jgi:YegS/Rv2252/BmrU family lipid kinase
VKTTLRRVALIYNPASGQYSGRRAAAVHDAADVLRTAGVEAIAFETDGPGSGTRRAREAAEQGCDAVIACGGDGTVHEVAQVLVGTEIALGVLPLGTANALASDLGLIAPPAEVARKLLGAVRSRIPVGRIHYSDRAGAPASRYFVVAAGIGPDALLMYRMDWRLKRRLGYLLYLIEATRIWATHPFPLFEASVAENGNGHRRAFEVSQLLAVRVRSFGGALRQLAPGATVHNGFLNLIAFRTRSRLDYMRFLLAVLAGRPTFDGSVQLLEASRVDCRAHDGLRGRLFAEADGEVLGSAPVRLEVVPDALTLLVPDGAEP